MLATVLTRASSSVICSRSCANAIPVTESSVALVDRHARKIVLLQHFEKALERDRLRNRKHLRARRHHFAHQLFAEFDGGAHQFAVALFENAFFFARLEQ